MFLLGEICRGGRCEVNRERASWVRWLNKTQAQRQALPAAASEPDNEHDHGTQRAGAQAPASLDRSQQRP